MRTCSGGRCRRRAGIELGDRAAAGPAAEGEPTDPAHLAAHLPWTAGRPCARPRRPPPRLGGSHCCDRSTAPCASWTTLNINGRSRGRQSMAMRREASISV